MGLTNSSAMENPIQNRASMKTDEGMKSTAKLFLLFKQKMLFKTCLFSKMVLSLTDLRATTTNGYCRVSTMTAFAMYTKFEASS